MEKDSNKKLTASPKPQREGKTDAKPRQRRGGPERARAEGQYVQTLSYERNIHNILDPYVDAVHRLYDCSCREKLRFFLDVSESRGKDGVLTVKAALLTSRDEADGKDLRDGKVTERRWHNVFRKERRLTDNERLDVRDFCTAFIEWCTFLFTDRKALVRELNVGRQRRFLWFRL